MNKIPKFKKDDIVKHIDGRLMTVLTHNASKFLINNGKGIGEEFSGTYWCSWTDSKGRLKDESGIPEESLTLTE